MSQFSLNDHPCTITSYNARSEKHGKEEVPAADVKFSTLIHSSVLDNFDPTLRPFLFRRAESAGDQPPLIEGDTLTALDKPLFKPLESEEEFPGYTLSIGSGLDVAEPLQLADVKLAHWKFAARKGGAIELTFTAAIKPDRESAGVLSTSVKRVVNVTATPPQVHPQKELPVGDTLDQQEREEAAADAEA